MKMPKATQRPSGNWRVQLMIDGNMMSVTGNTEEEAVLKAMSIKHGAEQYKREPLSITLSEAYDRYIESKDSVLAPSTVAEYKRMQKNDLPGIMKLPLKAITQEKVQREINSTSKVKSPKYVRNVHGLLCSVLKEYHPNMVLRTTLPQKIKYDAKIPSKTEIQQILQFVRGTPVELPVYLSAWLGLRLSEIRGLRWDAYSGKTLIVKEAVVTVNGESVSKGTKTYSSKRTLTVPPYIQKLIESQPKNGEYIVQGTRDSIYKKFTRLCAANGIPHYRFHDLRHANASVMLALGIPDKYAMERMGHATNNMLKTIYQHTMDSEKIEMWNTIDGYFESLISPEISPDK